MEKCKQSNNSIIFKLCQYFDIADKNEKIVNLL